MSRLKRRGVIASERRDGAAGYRLTEHGEAILRAGDARIFGRARRPGRLLVVFSIPEARRALRHRLRAGLAGLGLGTVAPAVWIAPAHLEEGVRALAAELGVAERVELFAAQALGGDPAHWWDLERIAAEYARYAAASAPALDGDRTPARAFADYMRQLDDWRPIPFHDPGLPAESLPADWRVGRVPGAGGAPARTGAGARPYPVPVPVTVAIAGGAGGVGSSLAFNLLLRPEPYDVVVIDRRPQKVLSHVMDLEQVVALGGGRSVRPGTPDDIAGAGVLVVCAAAALTANTSRSLYLRDNAAIVGGLAERLADWPGVLIMVTNPVDALCTWAVRRYGLERRRVVGYTFNDSLRLRTALAGALDAPPADVEAWVLGEHGDAAVPIFSRVAVGGRPVAVDAAARAEAETFVRTWYRRHVALDSRRSSTWTSGAGIARLVGALGGGDLWVASVMLAGEYGVEGVSVGVPVALGPDGAEVRGWELAPDELSGLRRAAEAVRVAAASL